MPPGARISAEERARRELALTEAPLFANLPKRHLRSIAKVTGVREYEKGASVIREGDPGSAFYVWMAEPGWFGVGGRRRISRQATTSGRSRCWMPDHEWRA